MQILQVNKVEHFLFSTTRVPCRCCMRRILWKCARYQCRVEVQAGKWARTRPIFLLHSPMHEPVLLVGVPAPSIFREMLRSDKCKSIHCTAAYHSAGFFFPHAGHSIGSWSSKPCTTDAVCIACIARGFTYEFVHCNAVNFRRPTRNFPLLVAYCSQCHTWLAQLSNSMQITSEGSRLTRYTSI